MKIGIIGAGMIGGTLARRLTALGHEVAVANSRGPETLRDLAAGTGARAVTAEEAARSGEIVIVTIPQRAVLQQALATAERSRVAEYRKKANDSVRAYFEQAPK